MTERDVQKALRRVRRSGSRHLFVNCHYWCGEADFLQIRKSLRVEEFEIKLTMSDYKRDFTHKTKKHGRLELAAVGHKTEGAPNRFWFVLPEGLASEIEVPDYAGLIGVDHFRSPIVMKQAPLIHKKKINGVRLDRLLTNAAWRLIDSI